jgi:23S rRNA (pseudouridine1915-N3)-methyltransferase
MIKIICLGKIKEKYLKEAINDYIKRLSKYTTLKIIELDDEEDLDIEETKIIKYIDKFDYLITLQLDGTMLDSVQLSNKLEQLFIDGKSNITFVIGSSNGLSDNIKNKADYKLSFSKLTFPHQLFRLLLIEQLYRSFKIINNETYHK